MKKALSILMAYITCTDPGVKTKWANVLASFWHKDSGGLVTAITKDDNGNVTITLVDGDGAVAETVIEKTQLPTSHDIDFINGLNDALNNKVDKIQGKGLSSNDFTTVLKSKLENLGTIPTDISQLTDLDGVLNQSIGSAELKPELKATVPMGTGTVVDWAAGIQFEKTLTADTTLSFSNVLQGKTITLVVAGNYAMTLPSGFDPDDLEDFDPTMVNYIQIYCANATAGSEVFLTSITTR